PVSVEAQYGDALRRSVWHRLLDASGDVFECVIAGRRHIRAYVVQGSPRPLVPCTGSSVGGLEEGRRALAAISDVTVARWRHSVEGVIQPYAPVRFYLEQRYGNHHTAPATPNTALHDIAWHIRRDCVPNGLVQCIEPLDAGHRVWTDA